MSKDIYLVFYSIYTDDDFTLLSFSWKPWQNYIVSYFSGVFSHLKLITSLDNKKTTAETITLYKSTCSGNNDQVQFRQATVRSNGYGWMKLTISYQQHNKLISLIKEICSRKTYFDTCLMWGCKRSVQTDKKLTGWFCSQLIGYILQEIDILPKELNPIKLSPTSLYLLVRVFGAKSITNPYLASIAVDTSADAIYRIVTGRNQVPTFTESEIQQFSY